MSGHKVIVSLFGAVLVFSATGAAAGLAEEPIRAKDVVHHLQSLGPWVNWNDTVDTFKAGDPERAVTAVAVSWMSTLSALREARDRSCEFFITHEPTFYSHRDDDPAFDGDKSTLEKRRLLQETGMVVYRCHDVWDMVPVIGVRASWAKALGLEGEPLAEKGYYAVYELAGISAASLAKKIAQALKPYGQEAVQVVGDLQAEIRRLAIGTGAVTDAREMRAMGADAAVVTEITYWQEAHWARDMGFPLFIVSHEVSECPGLENLARHLGQRFPSLRIEYIQEACPFRLVGPDGPLTR